LTFFFLFFLSHFHRKIHVVDLFLAIIKAGQVFPPHPSGGPDFDAFEPIENPWTREGEGEGEGEGEDDEDIDPASIRALEIIAREEIADPAWVDRAQLRRVRRGRKRKNNNDNNDNNNDNNFLRVSTRTSSRQNIDNVAPYSFHDLNPGRKIEILFMNQWKEATVIRRRQNGSWIVRFAGDLGSSIDLIENDPQFPSIRWSTIQ
jgi:hypothetical protein